MEVFIILPALCITIIAIVVLTISNDLIGVVIALHYMVLDSVQHSQHCKRQCLQLSIRVKRSCERFIFTAFDLGIGLGAILLGVVSQMFGYRILFSGSAISALIALIIFVFFVKQRLGKKSLHKLGNKDENFN